MAFKPFQKGNKGGPGRPKGTTSGANKAIEWAEKNGGWELLMRMAEGKEMGFSRAPKVRADLAMYLMDRAYGKPTQAHELAGKDGGPLTISLINYGEGK